MSLLDTILFYGYVACAVGFLALGVYFYVFTSIHKPSDDLSSYKALLGLKNANMTYPSDLAKLQAIILPARESVFSPTESEIFIFDSGKTELYLMAYNNDVRVWIQPSDVLKGIHFVLDGSTNNPSSRRTNLIRNKLPSQTIDLEGNFPTYFKLYCDKGGEIVALQVISPDIMAYILDNMLTVDIEVIDGQIALISRDVTPTEARVRATIELALRIDKLVRAVEKVKSL